MSGVCASDGEGPGGLFSFEEIYKSYLECRKNKRNTINALAFEAALFDNLHSLTEALKQRTYVPSRSMCFVVKQPKLREIFAADFRDRVVHHLLVRNLEQVFEPKFIGDSFACRCGKGTLAGVKRLRQFMRKITCNGTREAWYLQLDVKGFFIAINKQILYRILSEKVKDERVLWLARVIIFHDPTKDYLFKGRRGLLDEIPPHKTLFSTANLTGLPIGNLTSQFFANVYLDRLDQFVKHVLKVRYYVRYVDDLVMLDSTDAHFGEWQDGVNRFLGENLSLDLNDKRTRSGRVSGGVDFLGYIVRPGYMLVRRRSVNNLKARLLEYERRLVERREGVTVYLYPLEILEDLLATLNSYLAHFKHADTFRLAGALFKKHSFLGVYFAPEGVKAIRRYPGRRHCANYPSQVAAIRRCFKGAVCFIRIGKYYELYDEDAAFGVERLGLRLQKPRPGFGKRCGFHRSMLSRYVARAVGAGVCAVLVEEGREYIGGCKVRHVDRMVRPACPAGAVGRPACALHADRPIG
jgi:RNA-directed DNA polymerase